MTLNDIKDLYAYNSWANSCSNSGLQIFGLYKSNKSRRTDLAGIAVENVEASYLQGPWQDRPFATALAGPEGLKTFRTASPALVKTYQASPPIGVCEGEFSSLGI